MTFEKTLPISATVHGALSVFAADPGDPALQSVDDLGVVLADSGGLGGVGVDVGIQRIQVGFPGGAVGPADTES